MKVSDDARTCVAFLGHCDPSGEPTNFKPFATGFFLRHGTLTDWVYLVTARHNVQEDYPFWIRVNGRYGGATLTLIESPEWTFHEDPSVDVAVLEFPNLQTGEGRDSIFYTAWSVDGSVTERWHKHEFGPGDLAYTVGLFAYHRGEARNIPLVHTGNIATFYEDEKVRIRDWRDRINPNYLYVDAYVVQCTVLPGASGSPVFVRQTRVAAGERHVHTQEREDPHRRWGTQTGEAEESPMWGGAKPTGYGDLYLLGLWHGSWETDDIQTAGMTITRNPAGYGVVVPAPKIMEVLNTPKLKERREKAAAELKAARTKTLPVADS